MMSTEVGHSGNNERSALMIDYRMLIQQHTKSKALEFRRPGACARIVFVIPGHEECAMPRAQLSKRRSVCRQLPHRPINHITGHRDEIGLERVDSVDDLFYVLFADGRPDMDVTDLNDRKSV